VAGSQRAAVLGVSFLWQLKRLLEQSPILALLAVQFVDLCVEERAPIPRILANP